MEFFWDFLWICNTDMISGSHILMVSVWLFTDFMYCYRVNSVHSFIYLFIHFFLLWNLFIYLSFTYLYYIYFVSIDILIIDLLIGFGWCRLVIYLLISYLFILYFKINFIFIICLFICLFIHCVYLFI